MTLFCDHLTIIKNNCSYFHTVLLYHAVNAKIVYMALLFSSNDNTLCERSNGKKSIYIVYMTSPIPLCQCSVVLLKSRLKIVLAVTIQIKATE